MKQVAKVYAAPNKHWVGDGFHVHGMFNYQETHKNLDPFLLMDYASPEHFDLCCQQRRKTFGRFHQAA